MARARTEALLEALAHLPTREAHEVMVPLGGTVAFAPGRLVNTDEVLAPLGAGYFASKTAGEAAELARRRLAQLPPDEAKAKARAEAEAEADPDAGDPATVIAEWEGDDGAVYGQLGPAGPVQRVEGFLGGAAGAARAVATEIRPVGGGGGLDDDLRARLAALAALEEGEEAALEEEEEEQQQHTRPKVDWSAMNARLEGKAAAERQRAEAAGEVDETALEGMAPVTTARCQFCGVGGARERCGRCRAAVYCDRECQRQDWRRHKPGCEPRKKAQARNRPVGPVVERAASQAAPVAAPSTAAAPAPVAERVSAVERTAGTMGISQVVEREPTMAPPTMAAPAPASGRPKSRFKMMREAQRRQE